MKKIISFSLFGNKPIYCRGAVENAKLQPQIYPDWKCRFYIHLPTVPNDIIKELEKYDCELVFKKEEIINENFPGRHWRHECFKDNNIEMFIVRDADSRLNERDKKSVDEWLKSGKSFHIIRDHPNHKTRIMGGMYGATKKAIDKIDYDILYVKYRLFHEKYGNNQVFLGKMIYPIIKNDVLIHDYKHFYHDENVSIIQQKRTNSNFIGKIIEI